jgi:hypothetical protein
MLLAAGCQTIQDNPKTTLGAGVGAAGGAIVGGLAGGRRGAIFGALVGAFAGGAVGQYLDHQDKTAAQTNAEHDYKPSEGLRLELSSASANPTTVSPGDKVELAATYALMGPDPDRVYSVTETRVVTLNGAQVSKTSIVKDRTAGTYTSKVPVTLLADAAKGTYELTVTVATDGQSGESSSTFTVQ